jgi:uncharacterized OB-fold protein
MLGMYGECRQRKTLQIGLELNVRKALKKLGMSKEGMLRETKCKKCGKTYWTNRETDICMDCETKLG